MRAIHSKPHSRPALALSLSLHSSQSHLPPEIPAVPCNQAMKGSVIWSQRLLIGGFSTGSLGEGVKSQIPD